LVTNDGFTGTLCGSCVPLAMVSTETRSPPICAAMSATSGSVATTRSVADAGPALARPSTARPPQKSCLALSEAMAVTPDEGRPLGREALVGLLVAPGVVELEAQALELGGLPGDERRDGLREILVAVDRFGVVEAHAGREAAVEEGLGVGVAALPVVTRLTDH